LHPQRSRIARISRLGRAEQLSEGVRRTLAVAAQSLGAGSLSGSGMEPPGRRVVQLSCTRTSGLTILKAAASRFSDSSIRFGQPSSGESQLPGDSGEPALASADLFACPTPRDCPGQRVSAFFLSTRSRESPAARVRGWTFQIDAGIGQTRAPNP
jgi:hypothetical protein